MFNLNRLRQLQQQNEGTSGQREDLKHFEIGPDGRALAKIENLEEILKTKNIHLSQKELRYLFVKVGDRQEVYHEGNTALLKLHFIVLVIKIIINPSNDRQ